MRTIEIIKSDITKLDTDAIVNAANSGLQAGGGVCGAIFKAAGYTQLQKACDQIGGCAVGSAAITPGFDLKAGYIIHAVGPRWVDGQHDEFKLLTGAYKKALELAVAHHCKSVGFPLISAGIFGYPVPKAWRDAIFACSSFLNDHPENDLRIVFAVRDDEIMKTGEETLKKEAWEYAVVPAVKADWKTQDMPEQCDHFVLKRHFTDEQMLALRHGNIPQEMEDKWFWYMEGDTLYAHRSWTGFCLYIMEFRPDDLHRVTVNRDPEQYKNTDLAYDAETLDKLLNWWCGAPYDYYNEWLAETVDMLKKNGVIRDKLTVAGRQVDAVYFHKPDEPDGYLSNWYPSPFTLDGVQFSSAEQCIMYQKCMIFGDHQCAEKILATDDTKLQQALGREAKGYISDVWVGIRQIILRRALLAKFTQNEDLKKKLLDTGDCWLVECARTDKIWACGIRLDDDRRFDAANWRGQNILGFTLMDVREMLR